MPVVIRLARLGRRHLPFYRIRVCNKNVKRDGKFLEEVGTYNPIPLDDGIKEVRLNVDRIKYWLSVGAQPSETAGILPPLPLHPYCESAVSKKKTEEGEGAASS
ncbi:Ribosomal protein S16 [Blastocystis hominis]|nr:Ribosomal protein S16 [Blastocystis hominis]CBK23278.2 Ribosomal protein S16 [Blastocystis hominis]|eukprot:XP_012897326.1 Ribosomal protein S16 [Blastocystis hominis]